jgi:radical SAM superfamily enzyme YgiQ (UPF0313 family)
LPISGSAGTQERVAFKAALIRVPDSNGTRHRRPALGLAYLCTYLKANGLGSRVFDAYYHRWKEHELVDRVVAYKPDLIGITAMTHEIHRAAHVAGRLKSQTHAPVVIGGCHVTALPKRTLKEFREFDYGVYGEGEKTFLEIGQYVVDGVKRLRYVDGLIYRDGEDVGINSRLSHLSPDELDALPFPAFEDYYGEDSGALSASNACYVLSASRGCSHSCAFCVRVLGRTRRVRSAENVIREMERAVSRWGAHSFDFYDEILLEDSPETLRMLGLMVERGFASRLRWYGVTRPDSVNREIAHLAARAGCFQLGLGVESGDDGMLRAVGKEINVGDVRRAFRVIKDAGIAIDAYFILGHPNESEEQMKRTVDLVAELNPDAAVIDLMVPYPGTGIYEMALRGAGGYHLLTEDWSQYDQSGSPVLELDGVPHKKLLHWRSRAIINL